MLRKTGVLFLLLVAGGLLALAGRFGWKHTPPYELGLHSTDVQAQSSHAGAGGPRIGNCTIFPADNVWNTPIDKLPKSSKTDAYVDSIGPLKKLHPDFGSDLLNGIPFSDLPPGTRRVRIPFEYADESDPGGYPIPADAPIEGGRQGTGDRHVILIDQQRCLLYEIFNAQPQSGGDWAASAGIKMDLTSNALRPDGKTSGDAAGLPILPGLVRYEEVAAGEIRHALRFTVPHTQSSYVWPARHKASHNADANLPPLGMRFRLRADFDGSHLSRENQVIVAALKKYGMFLADNGSALFLSGVPDKRWSDSDLHNLNALKAEDFEAVDESDWQLLPDSARVDPVALKH